jgi:ubiquinone/menaquinone biosynthesis C-methylase UbiE
MAGWWDRHVVPRLICFSCGQPQVMAQRREVVPLARGRVLELGAGGGLNLSLYDRRRVTQVEGIDPSDGLMARADSAKAEWSADFFRIHKGVAEDLPFPAGSFDTVVSTFTLCSVTDQGQALKEAKRVLAPGGRLLFLEHGLAPDEATRRWQRRIEPFWKPIAGGCHLTRPVTDAVVQGGFVVAERNGRYMENAPHFAGWVEWGSAVPVG